MSYQLQCTYSNHNKCWWDYLLYTCDNNRNSSSSSYFGCGHWFNNCCSSVSMYH